MDLTTKDIIKLLPFEEAFKIEFLENFDNMPSSQKFAAEQVLWDAYFAMYNLRLDTNLKLALEDIKNNNGQLDKDFYKKVEEKTISEMNSEKLETTEKVDLSEARKAMELIIKEMRASKIKTVN